MLTIYQQIQQLDSAIEELFDKVIAYYGFSSDDINFSARITPIGSVHCDVDMGALLAPLQTIPPVMAYQRIMQNTPTVLSQEERFNQEQTQQTIASVFQLLMARYGTWKYASAVPRTFISQKNTYSLYRKDLLYKILRKFLQQEHRAIAIRKQALDLDSLSEDEQKQKLDILSAFIQQFGALDDTADINLSDLRGQMGDLLRQLSTVVSYKDNSFSTFTEKLIKLIESYEPYVYSLLSTNLSHANHYHSVQHRLERLKGYQTECDQLLTELKTLFSIPETDDAKLSSFKLPTADHAQKACQPLFNVLSELFIRLPAQPFESVKKHCISPLKIATWAKTSLQQAAHSPEYSIEFFNDSHYAKGFLSLLTLHSNSHELYDASLQDPLPDFTPLRNEIHSQIETVINLNQDKIARNRPTSSQVNEITALKKAVFNHLSEQLKVILTLKFFHTLDETQKNHIVTQLNSIMITVDIYFNVCVNDILYPLSIQPTTSNEVVWSQAASLIDTKAEWKTLIQKLFKAITDSYECFYRLELHDTYVKLQNVIVRLNCMITHEVHDLTQLSQQLNRTLPIEANARAFQQFLIYTKIFEYIRKIASRYKLDEIPELLIENVPSGWRQQSKQKMIFQKLLLYRFLGPIANRLVTAYSSEADALIWSQLRYNLAKQTVDNQLETLLKNVTSFPTFKSSSLCQKASQTNKSTPFNKSFPSLENIGDKITEWLLLQHPLEETEFNELCYGIYYAMFCINFYYEMGCRKYGFEVETSLFNGEDLVLDTHLFTSNILLGEDICEYKNSIEQMNYSKLQAQYREAYENFLKIYGTKPISFKTFYKQFGIPEPKFKPTPSKTTTSPTHQIQSDKNQRDDTMLSAENLSTHSPNQHRPVNFQGTCEGLSLNLTQEVIPSEDNGFLALGTDRKSFVTSILNYVSAHPEQATLLAADIKQLYEHLTPATATLKTQLENLLKRYEYDCSKTYSVAEWEKCLKHETMGVARAYINGFLPTPSPRKPTDTPYHLTTSIIKLWALATQTTVYLWQPTALTHHTTANINHCQLSSHSPSRHLDTLLNQRVRHLLCLSNHRYNLLTLNLSKEQQEQFMSHRLASLNQLMTYNLVSQPQQPLSFLEIVGLQYRIHCLEAKQATYEHRLTQHDHAHTQQTQSFTNELNTLKAQLKEYSAVHKINELKEVLAERAQINQDPHLKQYYHHLRMMFTVFCTATQMVSSGVVQRASYATRDTVFEGILSIASIFTFFLLQLDFSAVGRFLTKHLGIVFNYLPDTVKHVLLAEGKELTTELVELTKELIEMKGEHLRHGHNPGVLVGESRSGEPARLNPHCGSLYKRLKLALTPETALLTRVAEMTCTLTEMEQLVDTVARWLTLRYQQQIKMCTLNGAKRFAECSMARLVEYIKRGCLAEGTGIDEAGRLTIARELVTMVANPYLSDKTFKTQEVKIEQQSKGDVPQPSIPESHLHCYSGLAVHTPTADGQVQVTFYNDSHEDALRNKISPRYGFRITYPGQGLANEAEEFGLIPAAIQPETVPTAVATQPRAEPIPSTPVSTQASSHTATSSKPEDTVIKTESRDKNKTEENNQIDQIKELNSRLNKNEKVNKNLLKENRELRNDMNLVMDFLQYALVTPGTNSAAMGNYHGQNLTNANVLRQRLRLLNPPEQQSSESASSYQSNPLTQTNTLSTPPPVTSSNRRNKDKQQTKKKSSTAKPKPNVP